MTQTTVLPPFLAKLKSIAKLVNEDIAGFSSCGSRFQIRDEQYFVKYALNIFFKGKLDSFIRQLHMYGFRKSRVSFFMDSNKRRVNQWCFYHPYFHRDKPQLIYLIKRKPQNMKYITNNNIKSDSWSENIERIKSVQASLSALDKVIAKVIPVVKAIIEENEKNEEHSVSTSCAFGTQSCENEASILSLFSEH
eukprot:snap_masked-scaffold_55-processed-gene-0.16-mRNA-1 protein AED:1.00 eAED:1.00 QI:0/-1/0/0/-1/1/1/0/192